MVPLESLYNLIDPISQTIKNILEKEKNTQSLESIKKFCGAEIDKMPDNIFEEFSNNDLVVDGTDQLVDYVVDICDAIIGYDDNYYIHDNIIADKQE